MTTSIPKHLHLHGHRPKERLPIRNPPSSSRLKMEPSRFSHFDITHNEFNTRAFVDHDGRMHIDFKKLKEGPLSIFLSGANKPLLPDGHAVADADAGKEEEVRAPPRLNIVVMVIGSRGDVQPFVAVAKVLAEQGGHRVRLATHPAFKSFVEENGVEFFDVGGDPAELMAFMVKNPGLVPSLETIKAGDLLRRREQMFDMFQGFWRACVEPNDGRPRKKQRGGSSSADSETSTCNWEGGTGDDGEEENPARPFIADAIIANPPCFAHVHCAEKLGVPLHLMFTFPYSPTTTMPHPLANIQNSNVGREYTNAISYPMIEMMTWQGLGDLINRFREKKLGLEPVATLWAPGMISRLKVPYSYMWSPALIPKPHDWGDHIDITGFVFLDLASSFTPPEALARFLAAGDKPVYIGFGSIVVDDPDALTTTIFEAVKLAGVRALVSKGWGGIGGGGEDVPQNVFMLDNTPHDWLFSQVSCVVHHGGAGTTAIGLYHGCPTMIVPFFGDQAFWGATVANAGAGAEPIPHKALTAEKLADGIRMLLSEGCQAAAKDISRRIKEEDGNGAENAVKSFYRGLDNLKHGKRGLSARGKELGEGGPGGPAEGKWGSAGPGIRCAMLEDKVAVWRVRKTKVKLSALAAWVLVQEGQISWRDLRLVRHTEWNDFDGPGEPVSGGFSALFSSVAGVAKGVVSLPYSWYKGARRFDEEEGLDLAGEMRSHSSQSRSRSKSERARNSTDSVTPDRVPDTGVRKAATAAIPEDDCEAQQTIHKELAHNTAKGLLKAARASARAPVEVSLAVAQGFHNAPRLYGDTVRAPYRITGMHSGLRAAGKELALGVYDGVTGVVVKPYEGAKEGGPVGFIKGVGKGVAGGILKTNAAAAGVIGFTLKGVHKELRKKRDRKVMEMLRAARMVQGEMECGEWSAEKGTHGEEALREAVLEGWRKVEMQKEEKRRTDWNLEERVSGVKRGCGRRVVRKVVWRRKKGELGER